MTRDPGRQVGPESRNQVAQFLAGDDTEVGVLRAGAMLEAHACRPCDAAF